MTPSVRREIGVAPTAASGPMRLNLGSGPHPHAGFVNVDLIAAEGVIAHDLTKGIPFPDRTFDLVYHSTMLSHLRPREARALTEECFRVLRPGGILRVVTEDLEQMCRAYLRAVEEAGGGNEMSANDYDWMILELYDQATREYSGGRMLEYMQQDPIPNEAFVYSRIGDQARAMNAARRARSKKAQIPPSLSWRDRLFRWRAAAAHTVLARMLGRQNLRALEIGRFRLQSGQVSYQMYDRFSLARLLRTVGFSEVTLRNPHESGYALWSDVNIDLTSAGVPARPHALIMEGLRSS